ncbi:pilus assembly protein CpaE [Lacisediminihabitans changchengi]|uniref:Pilus assembly protein CpaE n=1 Tax=Lacisediminihabitans changchengi TaxID=2787634 RepID=A0A934SJ23_9MICO|nr:pilus assembly protein CpaE [Lacisediminihabitans changchengi]MBK4347556.1 pilus assembly protein CpaE [Lacisediminihabitans changchengi]
MISTTLARSLQANGIVWRPVSGDAFSIAGEGFDGDVFIVSDMTVEAHEFDTGTILGFNGTTEWALDSVAIEQSLWLPREDQLRGLLGGAFRALRAVGEVFAVDVELAGADRTFTDTDAAEAYGSALLALTELSR